LSGAYLLTGADVGLSTGEFELVADAGAYGLFGAATGLETVRSAPYVVEFATVAGVERWFVIEVEGRWFVVPAGVRELVV
jgi:hypothetical protein